MMHTFVFIRSLAPRESSRKLGLFMSVSAGCPEEAQETDIPPMWRQRNLRPRDREETTDSGTDGLTPASRALPEAEPASTCSSSSHQGLTPLFLPLSPSESSGLSQDSSEQWCSRDSERAGGKEGP